MPFLNFTRIGIKYLFPQNHHLSRHTAVAKSLPTISQILRRFLFRNKFPVLDVKVKRVAQFRVNEI